MFPQPLKFRGRGKKSQTVCVLLHASVIQERESTCPSEMWANWDYLEIFCPILTSHKINHMKVCPYSVDLIRSTGRVVLQPSSSPYICLSFSSCLLGLWLPLWRCIPPAGRNRSILLVHQNSHCCQNKSEYNKNAEPQSLSPPLWHVKLRQNPDDGFWIYENID